MSLWSSILDALFGAWFSILDVLNKMPTLVGAIIAFFGVALGQRLSHRYTQDREDKKRLQEKAEELILILCQIQHSVFVLYHGLLRDAVWAQPPQPLKEGVIGNISLESRALNDMKFDIPRLPEPRQYQAILDAIHLDIQRADTFQRLYFLSVLRPYEAHVDALIQVMGWLHQYVIRQEKDSADWSGLFLAGEEEWRQLHKTYTTTHAKIVEAVARVIVPHRKPSRTLSRLWHHR